MIDICIDESFTRGYNYNSLNIISLFSVLSGVSVIINKNPIISVLFLIGLFLTIALYLMLLGINFIGLSYLLVYVGAVSILFLFILMLINIRISELSSENNNSIPLAIIIGVFFIFTIYRLIPSNNTYSYYDKTDNIFFRNIFKELDYNSYIGNNLFLVTSGNWDGALSESSHITSIGNVLYTNYPLLLIITSLILLLAMVGAIIITIKQK